MDLIGSENDVAEVGLIYGIGVTFAFETKAGVGMVSVAGLAYL
jgi:hypothetical protein